MASTQLVAVTGRLSKRATVKLLAADSRRIDKLSRQIAYRLRLKQKAAAKLAAKVAA